MAERINHNAASAVATTTYEAAKGGILAPLAVSGVGAVLGGLVLGGIAALIPPIAGAAIGIGVAGAVVSGLATFMGLGPVVAVMGGIAGIGKGARRVGAENAAYDRRQDIISQSSQRDQAAVAQQAFAAGQQSVVEELQKYQMAQIAQQQAAEQAKRVANKEPVGPATAKLAAAAGQAAGKQMGA